MNTETTETIEVEIVPAELGLEPAAKSSLELAFTGFFAQARTWAERAETIKDAKAARNARLGLKSVRVAAEKTRKQLKEDSLRMGKAIDGANNILLALIFPIEKKLEDIEKEEERLEAARIAALAEERLSELHAINHDSLGIDLGSLTDEQWSSYLQQAKDASEARIAREKKEQEEREAAAKKEAEEREAQRLENIRLKEEAEIERQKRAEEQRAFAEAQAKRDAELKAEREAAEQERQRLAKIAAEAEAKREAELKAEREAAQKERKMLEEREAEKQRAFSEKMAAIEAQMEVEREAARKAKEAEEKRICDELEAQKECERQMLEEREKAQSAPDVEKILAFAQSVRNLNMPEMSTENGGLAKRDILLKCESFAKWIEEKATLV